MTIDPEKVSQNYTKGGLWQAEQTPQVGGALALRFSLQETPKSRLLVHKLALAPDWRVAGLISEGPYNRGLSLVTKVSSSPHLSTHQNLKSLRRGQVGFNFVLHSDGLNNSKLTPGCVPLGNCGQNVHFKERRGGSDLWRPGCSSQIDFRSHPLDDHCQHIPSPHLPHFPQNFPLITPNRSKSTLPQNLLILHPACTPGYSILASGPFGGCF